MPTTEPRLAQSIRTTVEGLVICTDGVEVSLAWQNYSSRLANACESERLNAKLSLGGYGIHWPLIDEDLSINGLLRKLDS